MYVVEHGRGREEFEDLELARETCEMWAVARMCYLGVDPCDMESWGNLEQGDDCEGMAPKGADRLEWPVVRKEEEMDIFIDSHGGFWVVCSCDHPEAKAFGPAGCARPVFVKAPGHTGAFGSFAGMREAGISCDLSELDTDEAGWEYLPAGFTVVEVEPC